MQWDVGVWGLGLLVGMAVVFGLVAQLVVRTATRWLWLIAAAGFFVGGLFASEVWFGWATQEELQPNIDGLSFDEVLLTGLLAGLATVLVTRSLARRRGRPRAPVTGKGRGHEDPSTSTRRGSATGDHDR